MSGDEQYQLDGSAPELYQRYLVPAVTALRAADLLDCAAPVPGERVLDVASGTGVVARLAAERMPHPTGCPLVFGGRPANICHCGFCWRWVRRSCSSVGRSRKRAPSPGSTRDAGAISTRSPAPTKMAQARFGGRTSIPVPLNALVWPAGDDDRASHFDAPDDGGKHPRFAQSVRECVKVAWVERDEQAAAGLRVTE